MKAVIRGMGRECAGMYGRRGAGDGPHPILSYVFREKDWDERLWPWGTMPSACYTDIEYGGFMEDDEPVVLNPDELLITVGGDHSITRELVERHSEQHPGLAILQFDAHLDCGWVTEDDHGSVMRQVSGMVDTERSVQVGIRDAVQHSPYPNKITAHDFNHYTPDRIAKVIRAVMGSAPVYLTFDIDCLDPAFAPGTGCPSAGGPSTSQILELLYELRNLHVVGFDLVEYSPSLDSSDITLYAAAALINSFICIGAT